jgi:DNA-binding MarR family transcriptional regulator
MPKPSPYRPRTLTPIARVPGLDYDVLDELLGYSLRRAQVAMFIAFHEATRGMDITPPRFTALVIIGANPGIRQTVLGNVLGIARLTRKGEQTVEQMKRRVLDLDLKKTKVLNRSEREELLRLLEKLTNGKGA